MHVYDVMCSKYLCVLLHGVEKKTARRERFFIHVSDVYICCLICKLLFNYSCGMVLCARDDGRTGDSEYKQKVFMLPICRTLLSS